MGEERFLRAGARSLRGSEGDEADPSRSGPAPQALPRGRQAALSAPGPAPLTAATRRRLENPRRGKCPFLSLYPGVGPSVAREREPRPQMRRPGFHIPRGRRIRGLRVCTGARSRVAEGWRWSSAPARASGAREGAPDPASPARLPGKFQVGKPWRRGPGLPEPERWRGGAEQRERRHGGGGAAAGELRPERTGCGRGPGWRGGLRGSSFTAPGSGSAPSPLPLSLPSPLPWAPYTSAEEI